MDRKSILILAVCIGVLLAWLAGGTKLTDKLYPPVPAPTNLVSNAASPADGSNGVAAQMPGANAPVIGPVSGADFKFVARGEVPEELLVVSNDNAVYTFTSRGGGLKDVQLLRYPEMVSSMRRKNQPTNQLATLNAASVPPVFAILGDESLQGDGVFKLSSPALGFVHAEKSLPNGLVIAKDFQLGTNYLLTAAIRYENRSSQSLTLPQYQLAAGAATPMGPLDNGLAEAVLWYNGAKAQSAASLAYFDTNTVRLFVFPRVPKTEYLAGSNNVVWASAQNQFFTLALMPQRPASAIEVRMTDLPKPGEEEFKDAPNANRWPRALETALIFPAQKLAAGETSTNSFNIFVGPKEYETLARLAARFNNDIDQVMNFGIFAPISKALLLTMNWLHGSLALAYGLVIILITVVIKLIFWPLTQASTRSAKRMQALQPQLKALQEKYKDEPEKFPAKQWEFYKKNKVNPLSGCLPALLQVPVFIAFYGMLRTAIELRGAQFLWMGDLSKPDTIFHIPLALIGSGLIPVNPMPLIMGATLLWQASMTPVSPGMDPSQQKIMKFMPLMMLFFMYSQPSGLALYWTVSNLLTVLQTKLTKMQPTTGPSGSAPVVATVAPQRKKK